MVKKVKNTDFLFVTTLLLGLLVHLFFLFIVPFSEDESFYATIPFRLLNGDSLVQHEWHLTQFSALFSCLPVYIWTTIKGSADSMFIFLRCIYLVIHTSIAVVIYAFFRKHGKWAIMASMMFYIQISYRIQAISYQSMYVVFLLLMSLCLISIHEKNSVRFYIFAGICYACCCVCNPFFCLAFVIYLIVCVLWTKREAFKNYVIKIKVPTAVRKGKKLTKKQKRQLEQQKLEIFPNMESYNCFFKKEAVLWFLCGILIIAVIAVVFYLSTGGTIHSLQRNIENLLGSSEYDIASNSVFSKLKSTIGYFSEANLGMPWILPVIFIALFFDEKRKYNTHRLVYLSVSLLWTIIYMFAVLKAGNIYLCAISLPFCVISAICYLLTENKNETLFYCMYMPCTIATIFQYLAADTHLAAIGIVLVTNNVAGVFLAMDLFKEMHFPSKEDTDTTDDKDYPRLCRNMIIISFCVQILFYGIFYPYAQNSIVGAVKATTGPYSGLYMTEAQYDEYNKAISDMDVIKSLTDKDEPVLLASYSNWMYLYLDRPIATYTTWYRGSIDTSQLIAYYRENPEKIPKYIYVKAPNPQNANVKTVSELFEFTREDLSNGALLTVEKCKF